jgi:hypothetical protein
LGKARIKVGLIGRIDSVNPALNRSSGAMSRSFGGNIGAEMLFCLYKNWQKSGEIRVR